jgi:hypothetical protein
MQSAYSVAHDSASESRFLHTPAYVHVQAQLIKDIYNLTFVSWIVITSVYCHNSDLASSSNSFTRATN